MANGSTTLTQLIRAPFQKILGMNFGRFAFLGWDNNYVQRAKNAAGTDMVDIASVDSGNRLLLGGAFNAPMLTPIEYRIQTSAKVATAAFFVNANDATPLEVVAIDCVFSVANGATLTGYVSKELTGQAPGAGATTMSGTFNLNATANTVQNATLVGRRGNPALVIKAGEQLSFKLSAAITSIAGLVVTVWVRPYTGLAPMSVALAANGDIATMTLGMNIIPGMTVRAIAVRWSTAGSNVGTVTADITKDTSTDAPGAGSSVLAAALSVKTTANTTMFPSLNTTAGRLVLAQNDRLALKMTGTLTALAGLVVTVFFDSLAQNLQQITIPMWDGPLTDRVLFLSNAHYELLDVWFTWSTASSSGTATITRDTGTQAPAAGTALLTGTVSTAATANTPLEGTKIAVVPTLMLKPGDRVSIDHGGTTTSLAGTSVALLLRKL